MEVTTMRRIDGWIGTPMCALLTLVRKLTDPLRRRAPDQPKRILIVKLAEQGATVVAWSALRRATELAPDSLVAHKVLGQILAHDILGRKFVEGFCQ